MSSSVCIRSEDMQLFAEASHDCNPLHMSKEYARKSPFGQPVVFGVLGALRCLAEAAPRPDAVPTAITLDFPKPIFPDVEYAVEVEDEPDHCRLCLQDGRSVLLRMDVSYRHASHGRVLDGDVLTPLQEPRDLDKGDFAPGSTSNGKWSADQEAFHELSERLGFSSTDMDPRVQAALLMTSYLVGMVLPGRQALFSGMKLKFDEGANHVINGFDYQVSVRVFQPKFNFLILDIELWSQERRFATGEIRALFRQRPQRTASEWEELLPLGDDLSGKVALVIGGSRGLGAALAEALARRGATTFVNYRESVDEASDLQNRLKSAPGTIVLARADAADMSSCIELKNRIEQEYGRLDILICSACPSLLALWVERQAVERIQQYVLASTGLVLTPMAAMLELLEKSQGTIVFISSVAVTKPVAEWPHYVAAKTALEGLTTVVAAEYPAVRCLIVRPPRIDTDLVDSTLGLKGVLSPVVVATAVTKSLLEDRQQLRGSPDYLEF